MGSASRLGRGSGSRPRSTTLLAVFLGGALGTLVRAGLADGFPADPGTWPWPTFAANVVACLLLGWVAARFLTGTRTESRARPFLATGLCGGLSTFSTLQVELVHMLERDEYALAAGYAGASLAAGLAAVVIGGAIGRAGMAPAASA